MERSEIIKICEGLEIDLQSFENYLDSIYSQDISSEKIQDILINYAVSMTSFEESDWTYLAGKLINYNFKLKRFYLVSFLVFLYSLYLTFYNNIIFNLLFGIVLIIILIKLYFKEIKIIFYYVQSSHLNFIKRNKKY